MKTWQITLLIMAGSLVLAAVILPLILQVGQRMVGLLLNNHSPVDAGRITLMVCAVLLILAAYLPSEFARARVASHSVMDNLLKLEIAKAHWQADHPGGNEWPTRRDLLPYLTNGTRYKLFDQVIRPRNRDYPEVYIVNKIGAPASAYDPRSERLFTLESNMLPLIGQMK